MTIADSRVVAWVDDDGCTWDNPAQAAGYCSGAPIPLVKESLLAEAESQLADFRKVYIDRKQQLIDLEKERDALQSRLDAIPDVVQMAINTLVISCRPAGNVDVDDAAEIRAATDALYTLRKLLEGNDSTRAAIGCATTGEGG